MDSSICVRFTLLEFFSFFFWKTDGYGVVNLVIKQIFSAQVFGVFGQSIEGFFNFFIDNNTVLGWFGVWFQG